MLYTPNLQHRNASFAAQKSQWSISTADEINCFNQSVASRWSCSKNFQWGLCINGATPVYLGVSQLPQQYSLFVAKFVSDQQSNWHGYPVAPWLSPFDKPSKNVVDIWKNSGLITSSQRARIMRGKLCSL